MLDDADTSIFSTNANALWAHLMAPKAFWVSEFVVLDGPSLLASFWDVFIKDLAISRIFEARISRYKNNKLHEHWFAKTMSFEMKGLTSCVGNRDNGVSSPSMIVAMGLNDGRREGKLQVLTGHLLKHELRDTLIPILPCLFQDRNHTPVSWHWYREEPGWRLTTSIRLQ